MIIPIGKLKYMKDRRARQVHNEHIPIQIDDGITTSWTTLYSY